MTAHGTIALVSKRVMGFCEPTEYLEFMRQTPEFERMLTRSGVHLYKYWFSVTQDEQASRFKSRETDPLKTLEAKSDRQSQPRQVGRFIPKLKKRCSLYTDTGRCALDRHQV